MTNWFDRIWFMMEIIEKYLKMLISDEGKGYGGKMNL